MEIENDPEEEANCGWCAYSCAILVGLALLPFLWAFFLVTETLWMLIEFGNYYYKDKRKAERQGLKQMAQEESAPAQAEEVV